MISNYSGLDEHICEIVLVEGRLLRISVWIERECMRKSSKVTQIVAHIYKAYAYACGSHRTILQHYVISLYISQSCSSLEPHT